MFDEVNSRILQYLKPFSYVVEQKSIHRASELLFQSASAVSQQIAKLEEELGTPLFERKRGQKLTLLPAGKALYEMLPTLDNAIFRLRSDLKTFQTAACPPVRIGVLPLLRARLMETIASYAGLGSQMDFSLIESHDGTELCKSILAGDLDCALLWEEYVPDSLTSVPLYTSPLVLACHRSLTEGFGENPTREELYSLPLIYITIVYRRTPNLDAYGELPLTGRKIMQVDNPLAAMDAVRARLGAAIVCEEALRGERDTDIRVFPLEGNRFYRKIALALPNEMLASEHARFVEFFLATL